MKKKISFSVLVTSVAMAVVPLAAYAQAGGHLATVNGVAVPKAQLDFVLKQIGGGKGAEKDPQAIEQMKEQLIRMHVIAQEAKRRGFAKHSDVITATQLATVETLVRAYVEDLSKNIAISEADLKKAYEEYKGQVGGEEIKVAHILVKTKEEAEAVLARLKKGEKFDEIAKVSSQDPGSKANGGDLGWMKPASLVAPFAEAMQKLGKGETSSAPVQTQFGYHIIKVEDKRAVTPPALEEVKVQLEQHARQKLVEEKLRKLREAAVVK